MKPKRIWANLAVSDTKRTAAFYTELGFAANGKNDSKDLVSFFVGDNNFIIHFFLTGKLLADLNGILVDPKLGNEVLFSLSAESRDEVDQWVDRVTKAGGTIFAPPKSFEKGYFCGFADPDGHKFNVLFWPD